MLTTSYSSRFRNASGHRRAARGEYTPPTRPAHAFCVAVGAIAALGMAMGSLAALPSATENAPRAAGIADPPAVARWPSEEARRRFTLPLRRARSITYLAVSADAARFADYVLSARAGSREGAAVRVLDASTAAPADLVGPLVVAGPIEGRRGIVVRAHLSRTAWLAGEAPGEGEVLRVVGPNPWDPGQPMAVVTGSNDRDIIAFLERWSPIRGSDYEVERDGTRVRYGRFASGAEGAWIMGGRGDIDLRSRILAIRSGNVTVRYVDGEVAAAEARRRAAEAAGMLRASMAGVRGRPSDREGREGGSDEETVTIYLYPGREEKAIRTSDPRYSHAWRSPAGARVVHVAMGGGPEAMRLSLARAAVGSVLAETGPAALGDGAAVVLAGGFLGRDLDWWAHRLSGSGLLARSDDLLDAHAYRDRSYLIGVPSAGLMVRWATGGMAGSGVGEMLRNPDLMNRLASRWDAHAAALERAASGAGPTDRPSADLAFQRGISLAHEGYEVSDGYGSASSRESIAQVRALGADSLAISPYGFMADPSKPEIRFNKSESQGAGSENDAAILDDVRVAHEAGMRVMLKPQIWLPGGRWPGQVAMPSEEAWRAFFEVYGEFLAHYALLAALGEADLLAVGVELQATTTPRESDWRRLIARTRRLYGGPLTYAANWGPEFEGLPFWDALDYAGLDCYYPLARDPEADDRALAAGARAAAKRAEAVATLSGRPVILTEVGFPALRSAWVAPHDDLAGSKEDAADQARGYRALLEAFWERSWLAGMYWWKWPTSPPAAGEPLFSPRGRPAERVLGEWYGGSRGDP